MVGCEPALAPTKHWGFDLKGIKPLIAAHCASYPSAV